jgi:CBS domain-containing protein
MLQADTRLAMTLNKVSTNAHYPSSLPPQPAQGKLTWQDGTTANRTGIIRIHELLPKARDRLVTIGADAPLTEAAEFLFEPTCRMIVVCDPAGVMMGVITRTDIIRQIRHCNGCACATQCMTIMTRQVISCEPNDHLDKIWATMKEKELHSIPVVDSGGRPIGLLSARDALESLLASVEYEEGLLRDHVMGVGYR